MTTGPSPRCRAASPSSAFSSLCPVCSRTVSASSGWPGAVGASPDAYPGARAAGRAPVRQPAQAEQGVVNLAGRVRQPARGELPDPAAAADQQVQAAVDLHDLDKPRRTEFPEQPRNAEIPAAPMAVAA